MSVQLFIFFFAITLFIFYWVIGGALFAAIAYIRTAKLRTARFSTLFTLTALAVTYGASRAAYHFGKETIDSCSAEAISFADRFMAVFGCGVLEFTLVSIIGFAVLFVAGLFFLLISRAENQSWIDHEALGEDQEELSFDNV